MIHIATLIQQCLTVQGQAIALSLMTVTFTGTQAASARSCVVAGDGLTLEAGTIADRSEPDPGWIAGEAGRRVNIHAGPGVDYAIIDRAWVGSYVDIIGQGLSDSCETWARVRFPISGQTGWIHGRSIDATYPRAWW
ncbi:MAG: hypothetical protein EA367_02220 [Leptolyngbya sp. DLM2.Bin15]|nr:MAG: hypothetical protein EA367_02220 [Leptolyngbya sp. DLM2.Bin15]